MIATDGRQTTANAPTRPKHKSNGIDVPITDEDLSIEPDDEAWMIANYGAPEDDGPIES